MATFARGSFMSLDGRIESSGMLAIVDMAPITKQMATPEGDLLERSLAVLRARSDLLRACGFLHIAVFGSVARRDDRPESDIDLVVVVGPGVDSMDAMRVERLLAADLGREVQIISRCGLDEVRHAEILRDMISAF